MLSLSPDTKKEIEHLADSLGTNVPLSIDALAWSLPIIQALAKKVEDLEKKISDSGINPNP
jgi:hypothetical protein